MKKILFLALLFPAIASAQYDYFALDTVVIVRPANATPYAAGDAVRDTGTAVLFAFNVPARAGNRVWINYASLCADTVNISGANFTLFLYLDSAGVGKYIPADNGLFQQRFAIGGKRLPPISFSLKTYGTAAAGATGAWDTQTGLNIPFTAPSARKLYGLLIVDGAYTPKLYGSFRIGLQFSYY